MTIERVTRRRFLQTSAAVAGTLAAGANAQGRIGNNGKKNVILIISDTMRRDALGCFGGRWIQTPHLDVFAKRAVRCENAFLCSFPTVPIRQAAVRSEKIAQRRQDGHAIPAQRQRSQSRGGLFLRQDAARRRRLAGQKSPPSAFLSLCRHFRSARALGSTAFLRRQV